MKFRAQNLDTPIQGEILSIEHLEEFAGVFASELKLEDRSKVNRTLLPRARHNGKKILAVYQELTKSLHNRNSISPAAEWLIDNFHIIEEQLRKIKVEFPLKLGKALPCISIGDQKGKPRIYGIAYALVAHTDSHFEQIAIRKFMLAFQKISPLSMAELWALPIALELVLIENLRRTSSRVLSDHQKKNFADQFADELFNSVNKPEKFKDLVAKIPTNCGKNPEGNCAFTARLAKRLRDQEPELFPALDCLEKYLAELHSSTEETVNRSHQLQASYQVSIANIITSMRFLSSLDWKDFFETVCLVDQVLREDPIYPEMDFETRDRYRQVIERISRRTQASEIEISKIAIQFANQATSVASPDQRLSHVGYYLIGEGIKKIQKKFAFSMKGKLNIFAKTHLELIYFALSGVLLFVVGTVPIYYSHAYGASFSWLFLIALLILVPCSEFSQRFASLILARVITPRKLPKLELLRGIPSNARTIVAITCVLTDKSIIEKLLNRLEVHYLANSDPEFLFALVADFSDAKLECLPEDVGNSIFAREGITKLNQKYSERFYLFQRKRSWNSRESAWIGWDRKRGKIQEFNRLLRNDQTTSFVDINASIPFLSTIKFVIVLDANTELPRGTAKKLVGTILHPLNQPRFDLKLGRVTEGYGVLQPKTGTTLESSNLTIFSRLFSVDTGASLSESIFYEGNSVGQGLYDVDALQLSLTHGIPENLILSHDLFEGLYARVALVTDIKFLGVFPENYATFFTRQHRWVRGDWQIAAWILPWRRDSSGQRNRNRLSAISKWKILDNMRRTLVAPSTFLWFVLGVSVLPGSALFWCTYTSLVVILPSFWRIFSRTFKSGLVQALLALVFLAHQAVLHVDAIVRVICKMSVTKNKRLWQNTWFTELGLLGLLLGITFLVPTKAIFSTPLIAIWLTYPIFAKILSRDHFFNKKPLTLADASLLRQVARRTWHYFETFVNSDDHWLPPDNFQESPEPVVAHRTSPTNLGLYFLSLLSARDLGYVSNSEWIKRLGLTCASMRKLEKYKGHYLNWYDTRTLEPLDPKYVSTVDSGNLAAYLLVMREACLEFPTWPIVNPRILDGLSDIVSIMEKIIEESISEIEGASVALAKCRELFTHPVPVSLSEWSIRFAKIIEFFQSMLNLLIKIREGHASLIVDRLVMWTNCAISQTCDARDELSILAPWTVEHDFLAEFDKNLSLSELFKIYDQVVEPSLIILLEKSKNYLRGLLLDAQNLSALMDEDFQSMNFNFLLDEERGVFLIGYNVSENKYDLGLYDLLGSESRLTSFVAIAKGDVPEAHWFRLGRQMVPAKGGCALVSWTASMFEYLMPLLVMRDYKNTLLNETMNSVVARQIEYGGERKVPWGISEAGFNSRDFHLNYQYSSFGVPGLGLKRGLSHDLVISPYSTLLASMVDPLSALKNMKRLMGEHLLTSYGFYESVDYTPERLPDNQKFAVIRSYMAHHQGMSLVALNNVLLQGLMQNRFHRDPRVQATRLLLQEPVPHGVRVIPPKAAEIEFDDKTKEVTRPAVRNYDHADSSTPHILLLSNRSYSLMISTAGGGYSKCGDQAVTRWRPDATRDNFGSFIFIRDRIQSRVWSTTYQPFNEHPENFQVTFKEEKAEFRRKDGDISTYTQIIVSPDDNVEIRHVRLSNHSDEPRVLELTSYLEPVLGPLANDSDHPAFSKLFIQTEFLQDKNTVLGKRRKKTMQEAECFGWHGVASDGEVISGVQFETDRNRFIGRGRSLVNSIAMQEGEMLSSSNDVSLDPIFSLRIQIRVPANGISNVAFTTGIANTREVAVALADRYQDIHAFDREINLAWTKSQADLNHLDIDAESAYLYQRLAESLIYLLPKFLPSVQQISGNGVTQVKPLPGGIPGFLPIVVVRIRSEENIAVVRKLIRCHEYLRLKGLSYDLVIFNEHETTYFQELQDALMRQIRTTGSDSWLNKPGGIHIVRNDINSATDREHLFSVARIVLTAEDSLKDQINRKVPERKFSKPLSGIKVHVDEIASDQPVPLEFSNGFGGFSENGREYIIRLTEKKTTPAPWVNVIGNALGFGFQVSEMGSGFTWSINSQLNRLTPWSNDPVCDPPGEIIYIRDEETMEVWTPTPLPIQSKQSYQIRHGQGYTTFDHTSNGIKNSLTLFVPRDESIKISYLKLKNMTSRKRKISISSYIEWVLGTDREKTSPFIICETDSETGLIFAQNLDENDFSDKVSFSDISVRERSFTCSRNEFLGRNGNYSSPAALKRSELSNQTGTEQDPCTVLQTSIELAPGEEREFSISLGQCETISAARELALRYRDIDQVKKALREVIEDWDRRVSAVQIKTPEPAINILMNSWLLYQTLSCRYWARTAFYQSGGAFGFRDQLQDCMALIYSDPKLTRENILRATKHQFKEGDVQHWWHPPTGRGIRTRISDDLLWLPFVVSYYVNITGDHTLLSEKTPFLEAPMLKPGEEDAYTLPIGVTEPETVLEHCIRAINHALALGEHNLPLMGTGDWNDGMNRVGSQGKGESVWLASFLYKVLVDFLPFCTEADRKINKDQYDNHLNILKNSLEKNAWDGDWYRRAFFDDGSILGSVNNPECKIDSIAQSWAVLSNAGDPTNIKHAMEKVWELLFDQKSKVVLLFTPPFDHGSQDPGYIRGYLPGVRENGGQYTHAAVWTMMAYAKLGDSDKTFEIAKALNPILHSQNEAAAKEYRIEPYVIAGDVYSGNSIAGRGGWSWYTGSASWYYRANLESLLGFQLRGNKLSIKPCIPKNWKTYEIGYQFGKSNYVIQVENPNAVCGGNVAFEIDGVEVNAQEATLIDDGRNHIIKATLCGL